MAQSENTDFFGENESGTANSPIETSGLVEYSDPLSLELDDKTLVETVDFMVEQSRRFFKKRDIYKRRQKNVNYYLGKQVEMAEAAGTYKDHEVRYMDNIIYEAEATLKPIALSKMPDLLVKPGQNNPASIAAAKKLTTLINSDLRKRENRQVLGRGYKHRPIYFIGCIKYLWDAERDDYRFESVHPDNVDFDHLAPDSEVDNMRWVAHHYELTAKQIAIRFPKKASKFLDKIRAELNIEPDKELNEKGMNSTFKISEVWFTWYEEVEDENGEKKWQTIEGVLWKYKDLLLHKMKNPNWDWEGKQLLYSYDENGQRKNITDSEIRSAMINNQNIEIERDQVFNNYLKHPEKPFIFLTYDQLGMMPMDETSRIEQVLYLQDNVNKRGKQISEMADTARGKNVFSTEGGITAEDVEKIDMTDPDQDILVKGEINKVHRFIPGQQPQPSLFEEQEMSRNKAFAKMGAHGTTRGEREARETATGRQILREADFAKQDDEVTDTINRAAERMARAALQMIKLRYTKDKLVSLLGEDGEPVFEMISQDLVEDGMEVMAIASGVDLLRRKEEAFEMARLNLIDPLTFFEDIDANNPKLRAQRLLVFTAAPELYLEQHIMDKSMEDMAADLENQSEQETEAVRQANVAAQGGQAPQTPPPQGGAAPAEPAAPASPDNAQQLMADIALMQQGQVPPVPANITPEYIQGLNDFINSPDFANLPPEVQNGVIEFARQVIASVQGQAGQ